MKALGAMIRKEFVHIGRDPMLIGFVIGIPMVLILLFGYALRLKADHLRVAVYDAEKTFFSVQVKDKLNSDGQFLVIEVDSEEAIREALKHGNARLGIVIPKGFSERLGRFESTESSLFVDGTMPTLAQAALYGARVLTDDSTMIEVIGDDPDNPAPPVRKPPITMANHILFNPEMRDSDFFLPGTIGIVLMIVVLTLSTGLVREKEQATIEQLLVTPIGRFALIAGKMIPYGIIAIGDYFLVTLVARLVFRLPIDQAFLPVSTLAVLFILALLALGAVISTVSQTQLQAVFLVVFAIVPSLLMSGFVFPIEAIPAWLQPVAWALPMTYFNEGIRGLMLKGTTVLEQGRDFAALTGFVVGLTLISLSRFRKTLA